MFGDSIQSAGDDDGILDTAVRNNREETGSAEGHIQDPKFYPSWAPELSRRNKTGGDNPVSKDVPLIRELEGKSAILRAGAQKSKKRPRAIDIYDTYRQYNQKLHGQEVPPLADGAPEIEECTISQYYPVGVNQICEGRMKYISQKFPYWSLTLRKLAAGAFVMSYTKRVDVVSMVILLHLSAGNTVLKIRSGAVMAYRGGFYKAVGDITPEHVLTHCALFAQTLEGLLTKMGDMGICSRSEDAVYCAVDDVYRRIAVTLSLGAVTRPNLWARDAPAPCGDPVYRVADHEVFAALRDAVSTEKEAGIKTSSWARAAASMCRKIDDTLHLTMVSGSIFSHYVEYLSPNTTEREGAFLRETIARSRGRGDSSALPAELEIYESLAIGGKCVLFPLLSMMGDTDCYIGACQAVAERIRERQKGGPIRVGRDDRCLGDLECADCLLQIGEFDLRAVHNGSGPMVYGKYIAKAADRYYACILGEEGSSIEAYPFVFSLDTTTAQKILLSVMNVDNIYMCNARGGVRL